MKRHISAPVGAQIVIVAPAQTPPRLCRCGPFHTLRNGVYRWAFGVMMGATPGHGQLAQRQLFLPIGDHYFSPPLTPPDSPRLPALPSQGAPRGDRPPCEPARSMPTKSDDAARSAASCMAASSAAGSHVSRASSTPSLSFGLRGYKATKMCGITI